MTQLKFQTLMPICSLYFKFAYSTGIASTYVYFKNNKMEQLKLEVGKQYLCQNGTTVTIMREVGGILPFACSDGFWRREDGSTPGAPSLILDLVKEIKEDEA